MQFGRSWTPAKHTSESIFRFIDAVLDTTVPLSAIKPWAHQPAHTFFAAVCTVAYER